MQHGQEYDLNFLRKDTSLLDTVQQFKIEYLIFFPLKISISFITANTAHRNFFQLRLHFAKGTKQASPHYTVYTFHLL